MSEQDGWRHLYLVDAAAGGSNQITKGSGLCAGSIALMRRNGRWFHAGGMNAEQDHIFSITGSILMEQVSLR